MDVAMVAIQEDRIKMIGGKYVVTCACGKANGYSSKNSALKMLRARTCRYCKRDYRVVLPNVPIFKTQNGK